MRDQLIAVRPEGDDVHRAVYSSVVGHDKPRDFIYSRIPVKTKSGEIIVAVRRPGVRIAAATYGFSLVASPQVSISPKQKRVPSNEGAVIWLNRQFEANGAMGIDVAVLDRGMFKTSERRIPFIDFGGSVRVEDPDLFSAWYTRGAGKARAYGFGMITLTLPLETP